MMVEHRTYTRYPGKTQTYFSHYANEGLTIQLEYRPNPIGYYTVEIGALNEVIHMWGYDSLDDRAQRRARLRQDERWSAYVAKSVPLIRHQESRILLPASFYMPVVAQYKFASSESAISRQRHRTRCGRTITYVATAEGGLYLTVIIDLLGRPVVGWPMQPHTRSKLFTDALHIA